MKTIYTILVILFLVPAFANAAPAKKSRDVRKYQTELNLTAQQMTQLNTIYGNFQARAKLQAPATNGKERMEQRLEMRKETRKQIMSVLTPDQKKKYREIMGIQPVRKNQ